MKKTIFNLALIATLTISSISHANIGESATEKWQCYSYHTDNSALVDRDCTQKAYEISQITGKAARCVFQGVDQYCQTSWYARSGTFAVVWSK